MLIECIHDLVQHDLARYGTPRYKERSVVVIVTLLCRSRGRGLQHHDSYDVTVNGRCWKWIWVLGIPRLWFPLGLNNNIRRHHGQSPEPFLETHPLTEPSTEEKAIPRAIPRSSETIFRHETQNQTQNHTQNQTQNQTQILQYPELASTHWMQPSYNKILGYFHWFHTQILDFILAMPTANRPGMELILWTCRP
jgi:hypothetical protein